MEGVDFIDLAKSAKFREFFAIVRELTGILLALTDVSTKRRAQLFLDNEVNPVCALLERCPSCASECARTVLENCALAAQGKSGTSYLCHAGMIDLAVPVFVEGRHVATFIGGQMLPEAPSEDGFTRFAAGLDKHGLDQGKLREAYFRNPHMSKEKVDSALKLVRFFSEYFYELGSRVKEADDEREPRAIRRVKEFIHSNLKSPMPLSLLAERTSLSGSYLSALFKKETGKNLLAYLWEARVEAAQKALEKTDRKIIEIAFDSGFGSLSQFNRVFKKLTGLSPSEHRKNVRGSR